MACTCTPGKKICRSCLNPTTKLVPYVGNPVNDSGHFTIHQIDAFQKEFERTIVADTENNPLTIAVTRHGSESFYSAVNTINNDFLKREFIVDQLPNFEVLDKRVKIGNITPLEFAAFIKENNYTPSTVVVNCNVQGPRLCQELNDFYNGDFTDSVMGGFCKLFGNIFSLAGAFFSLAESISGLVGKALAFLDKIKNLEDPLKALFEKLKVKALIEAIKKKITDAIEKTIKKIQSAIENFSVAGVMGKIESFVQQNIAAKVAEIKAGIANFFTKENIDNLLAKIKAKIDYAIGLFENPSLEEIQFLIARICGLASGIESAIKDLKTPLNTFADRYESVYDTLVAAGNQNTAAAVRAGAVRLSTEERQAGTTRLRVPWERAGNFVPPRQQEIDQLPTWAELEAGTNTRLKITGGWTYRMRPPSEGWTEMPQDVQIMVMRLQARMKALEIANYLILNSGYRSPWYNTLLRSEGKPAALNSMHLDGKAADLRWPGFNRNSEDNVTFVREARRIGFKGIGYYDTFTHVDTGVQRSWNTPPRV